MGIRYIKGIGATSGASWRTGVLVSVLVLVVVQCVFAAAAAQPVSSLYRFAPSLGLVKPPLSFEGGASPAVYDPDELAEKLSLIERGDREPASTVDRLSEVLADVWRTNPRVAAAEAAVEAAGYDISGARTGYYPYLAFDVAQGSSGTSTAVLRVVQPIWNGGLTGAKIDEAEAKARIALAELTQARLELGLKTVEAYLNVAAAKAQARRWDQYLEGLGNLLGVITRRAELGVSAPVDVETAVARIRAARAGARANAAVLVTNRSQLAAVLLRRPGQVVWPLATTKLTSAQIESVLGKVVEHHPERERALAKLGAAQARVEIAKASFWPDISLQYANQVRQARNDFTPDHSIQLVLQFTSSEALRGLSGYRAELQRVVAARRSLTFVHRQIAHRIRAARVQRRAARAEFEAQAASAVSFVRLVDSFLRQFKVGRKSWIEVLNAQRKAHDALLQLALIKRRFWLANAKLALQGMLWPLIVPHAPPIYVEAGDLKWPNATLNY